MEITMPIVNDAIKQAIEDAQLSIRTAYHVAVRSARKDNLFADVLLSCALAEADELGYWRESISDREFSARPRGATSVCGEPHRAPRITRKR